MIESLGVWLKELIVIILIATFMEMILPGKSMQRYVKVVVSLFILLTILKPIISFLQSDVQVDRLFAAAAESSAAAESTMQPLQGVLKNADDVRSKQEQQAMALLEERIGGMMREQLQEQFPVLVQSLSVKAAMLESGEPALVEILADLEPDTNAISRDAGSEESKAPASEHLVEPVKPVTVEVKVGEQSSTEDVKATISPAYRKQLTEDIIDWLSVHWDTTGAKVSIHVVDEAE